MLSSKDSDKDSMMKLLYHDRRIGTFTGTYPRTQNEFYSWSYSIKEFQTKNSGLGCSKDILFHKVIETIDGDDRIAWDQHRVCSYREYIAADAARIAGPESQKTFNETMDTIGELIKFTIKRVMVRPDILYFKNKLDHAKCLENESPKDTMNRVNVYLFQYESLRQELNPNIDFKLRPFQSTENVDLLRRVFITDNVGISYLNDKVNRKFSSKWLELEKIHISQHTGAEYDNLLSALTQYISTELTEEVLPTLDASSLEEGKRWRKYYVNTSLFTLDVPPTVIQEDAVTDKRDPKRKRERETTSHRPTNRYRGSTVQCLDGDRCTFSNTKRGCKFYHPELDESKQDETHHDTTQIVTFQSDTAQHAVDVPAKPQSNTPCTRGTSCPFWQRGCCYFNHSGMDMSCNSCGNKGHGMEHCPGGKQRDPATPRYSAAKPNHPVVRAHDPNALIVQHLTKFNDQFSGVHTRLDDIAEKVLVQQDRDSVDRRHGNALESRTKKLKKIQNNLQHILNTLQKDM